MHALTSPAASVQWITCNCVGAAASFTLARFRFVVGCILASVEAKVATICSKKSSIQN